MIVLISISGIGVWSISKFLINNIRYYARIHIHTNIELVWSEDFLECVFYTLTESKWMGQWQISMKHVALWQINKSSKTNKVMSLWSRDSNNGNTFYRRVHNALKQTFIVMCISWKSIPSCNSCSCMHS